VTVKAKAEPFDLPSKAIKHQIQAQDSKPADVLIGAVKAEEAAGLVEEPVSFEQQQQPDDTSIEAAAEDLSPLVKSPASAVALDAAKAADDEGAVAGAEAGRTASESANTASVEVAQSSEGAAAVENGENTGQPTLPDAAASDSLMPAGDHDLQAAASLASELMLESSHVHCAQEGPSFAGQASAEGAEAQVEATNQPSGADCLQTEIGMQAARADAEEVANSAINAEQSEFLEQEHSSTALLPPSEVSLKQPLMSQLSALFSCNRPGMNNGETVVKQKVNQLGE
jgi:hypothetical protein